MYVWNGARNNQRNLSDSLYGRGETHSDDSGLSAGEYLSLWDVYVPVQSAGGGGYGGGDYAGGSPSGAGDGFMNIPDGIDGELPF